MMTMNPVILSVSLCRAAFASATTTFPSVTSFFAFSALMRASNAATCAVTCADAAAAGFPAATAVAPAPAPAPAEVSSRIFFG
jgi:hypothetical protein